MNIKRRLAWNFISRLLLLLFIWAALFTIVMLTFELLFEDKPKGVAQKVSVQKIAAGTKFHSGIIEVNRQLLDSLQKNNMWLQILNETGKVIYSYNQPQSVPNRYAPGELVSHYVFPAKTGYYLSTWYDNAEGQTITWVIGAPWNKTTPWNYTVNNLWMASIIFTVFLVAILFGSQLGAPILHILSWVQTLSKGLYMEPVNRKGNPLSRTKHGRVKRSYRIYKEVIDALNQLTDTLKKSKEERERLEKTREEWMTGISHDIKTPLSTVKGYADMLASQQYHWNEQEVRRFAAIIQERSIYMEGLIEDFNLTFRLKNDALPLHCKKGDIIEFVREAVIDMANTPYGKKHNITFKSDVQTIYYSFDRKWLLRAIDNLLANAINHNPENTYIQVIVERLSNHGFQIVIRDNGIGMDEETKLRLFERYFRGTDTNQIYKGTGLGMAISRQLIEAHQGNILVNSNPNKGTEVIVRFEEQDDNK